ncbi:unnamed protein product, partial [Didymodactylos carnosus]
LDDTQKQRLRQVIQAFPDVFGDKTGRTGKVKHEIKLLPGSQPCNLLPYRYAPARCQIIEENVREMCEQGVIVPSCSPSASPVVLAPKKDGTLRFCVDYRRLNSMTIRDAYPIPRIDDTLDSLQEAKFISTLDLRTGYSQVEIDERSREKTAFITHKGLYVFQVMPYGLTNAPATFQRFMDRVLAGLKWQCCLVYIDDVIIHTSTLDQHLKDLTKKLTTAPIMNTPNFEKPFILELDACEYGFGAVLTQEYDTKKYVIVYASRTLAERKYDATEREALAIVWATKHFRVYIEGSKVLIRSDYVYNYVASCEACQQFKYNTAPMANPTQSHIVNGPWHTIGIDIMRPFPNTSRQKRFLLVIVDYFTRWVELFPLRTTTSIDVAQILINEVFSRFGFPAYILSDNGPQFVSNIFRSFCELIGIKQKFTANYDPQSNMTERVNRTLKPMLAIFAQNHPHSWDKEVQKLAFALRTSVNETTGETPAFMIFG